ncbi:MAG TPA: lytic murein transglycosylase [Roseiarcus sp.]|nr:lytic murein transglycosylase [Roseiarcus sp.]
MRADRFGDDAFPKGLQTLLWAGFLLLASGCLAFSADASPKSQPSRDHSFREFIASLWPLAEERGVSRQTFDRAFLGVSFDRRVVADANQQAEFARPIWDYIASAVSPQRIERGRAKAQTVSAWLKKANEAFGVDAGVIMGIWGLETDFGGYTGSDDVIRALASLASVRFRDDYFRDELLSALVILEEGDIEPRAMRGSWAGAMGQTQFMPSSFLVYAIDFEDHGRRDIWTSEADAIGSTANYLAEHGWKEDLPWGFEVHLPAGFVLTDADSSQLSPFAAFAARGVRRADGAPLPETGDGRLLIPAGLKGPIFLITTNFDVIMAYNPSTSYALSVALLGDAIKGGGRLIADWPKKDKPLGENQVRRLQAKLKQMGYDPGDIDGMAGDALRSAVRAYQARNGLTPDGYADLALMKQIDRGK